MSEASERDAEDGDDGGDETGGLLPEPLRTVTPPCRGRPDAEMDAIGWSLALGMVILLVPFLPLIAVVWAVSKVVDFLTSIPGED
jgi:hypothetical protein